MQNYKDQLEAFGLNSEDCVVFPLGSGHINKTFKVLTKNAQHYVLQQINTSIFTNPGRIVENWLNAKQHISLIAPDYIFLSYKPMVSGNWLYTDKDGHCWRMLDFVNEAVAPETVENTLQARLTAQAFARFTSLLRGADPASFHTILPRFHDLSFRQQQFDDALKSASPERLAPANKTIHQLQALRWITSYYEMVVPNLPQRIVHMDAKISNVLFNNTLEDVVCIIDLDTMMPGTLLSDAGDMIRSMVCPAAEDERDLSKIYIRRPLLEAIVETYSHEITDIHDVEKNNLAFGGLMLVYMQALRFMTDFLENDRYYKISYPMHNLVRAMNQSALLMKLLDEPLMAHYH